MASKAGSAGRDGRRSTSSETQCHATEPSNLALADTASR